MTAPISGGGVSSQQIPLKKRIFSSDQQTNYMMMLQQQQHQQYGSMMNMMMMTNPGLNLNDWLKHRVLIAQYLLISRSATGSSGVGADMNGIELISFKHNN